MNRYDTGLHGRRALVTGSGSGIGAGITATMRSAGANVRTCDIDPDSNADVACDVSNGEAVEALFEWLDDELAGLDIGVNNVGVAGPTSIKHPPSQHNPHRQPT